MKHASTKRVESHWDWEENQLEHVDLQVHRRYGCTSGLIVKLHTKCVHTRLQLSFAHIRLGVSTINFHQI